MRLCDIETKVHTIESESPSALACRAAHYRELFDKAPVGCCTITGQGVIVEANQTAAALLGESCDMLACQPLSRFVFIGDRDSFELQLKQLRDNGLPQSCELRMVQRDETIVWVMMAIAATPGTGGMPAFLVTLVKRELLEHQQQLHDIVEFLPDATLAVDREKRVIIWNRAIEEMTGVSAADMLGKGDHVYTIPFYGEARPQLMDLVLADDETTTSGYGNFTRSGNTVSGEVFCPSLYGNKGAWIYAKAAPLHDSSGRIIGAIESIRDITGRKQAEMEKARLEAQFQQTQKLESLGVLAGGIAHDFNNILSIIMGHCHILLEEIDSGIDSSAHVRQIENAAARAAEICRQMLTYAGKSSSDLARVDLLLIVEETLAMFCSGVKNRVVIEADIRKVPTFLGDHAQIRQVVMNLIINAAEAITDGNSTVRVALQVKSVAPDRAESDFVVEPIQNGNYVCLTVCDNGSGMDTATQRRIFEPFYSTKQSGRGLGLSAVLGIIKSHGGALQLTSAVGAGTTFQVYFPLPVTDDTFEPEAAASYAGLKKAHGSILLVDDEESLLIIGSAMLRALGFTVITACNGLEALELFRKKTQRIDLIILDLIMPELGGVETYRIIREESPAMPIVICSGYSIDELLDTVDQDRCAAVVQKPYRPDQLRSALMKLIDQVE